MILLIKGTPYIPVKYHLSDPNRMKILRQWQKSTMKNDEDRVDDDSMLEDSGGQMMEQGAIGELIELFSSFVVGVTLLDLAPPPFLAPPFVGVTIASDLTTLL